MPSGIGIGFDMEYKITEGGFSYPPAEETRGLENPRSFFPIEDASYKFSNPCLCACLPRWGGRQAHRQAGFGEYLPQSGLGQRHCIYERMR